jgi:hypothetical protein
MREVVLVLEPPDREADAMHVIDVIATMGTTDTKAPAHLTQLWAQARGQLKAPLELRPVVTDVRALIGEDRTEQEPGVLGCLSATAVARTRDRAAAMRRRGRSRRGGWSVPQR